MTLTEADAAAYTQFGEELQEDARALLATVRCLMSGYEMQVCEKAANIADADEINVEAIDRLRNQFAREIAAWKDGVRA